jgi:hypothetical protein
MSSNTMCLLSFINMSIIEGYNVNTNRQEFDFSMLFAVLCILGCWSSIYRIFVLFYKKKMFPYTKDLLASGVKFNSGAVL